MRSGATRRVLPIAAAALVASTLALTDDQVGFDDSRQRDAYAVHLAGWSASAT
jgi:hypothetical protein